MEFLLENTANLPKIVPPKMWETATGLLVGFIGNNIHILINLSTAMETSLLYSKIIDYS